MTADLHTHILPGMDDGARTVEESLVLLRKEQESGVDTVALTSHFRTDKETIEHYVTRRAQALHTLQQAVTAEGLSIRLIPAAEVMYSSTLLDMDPRDLCYAGTNTLLIELLPHLFPAGFEQFLFEMGTRGYSILIAHVDRYPYLMESPHILTQWVKQGCYCHINASAVLHDRKMLSFATAAIRHGLVHLIASDTHSVTKRPPLLQEAFALLKKRCGSESVKGIQENPKLLLAGRKLIAPSPTEMKKRFGKYV